MPNKRPVALPRSLSVVLVSGSRRSFWATLGTSELQPLLAVSLAYVLVQYSTPMLVQQAGGAGSSGVSEVDRSD